VFLECTTGFTMPAGSVVLLSSASHMAWCGTAAYAEDFVNAVNDIKKAFGSDVKTLHGLPIMLQGTTNSAAIYTWFEIEQWLTHLRSTDTRDITDSRQLNLHSAKDAAPSASATAGGAPSASHRANTSSIFLSSANSTTMGAPSTPRIPPLGGELTVAASPSAAAADAHVDGSPSAPLHGAHLSLPTSMDSSARSIFYTGFALPPPQHLWESQRGWRTRSWQPWLRSLMENLIWVWQLCSPAGGTTLCALYGPSCGEGLGRKLIVIGMSHASRLAAALELQGHTVTDLSQPGWKPDPASILELSEKIKSCLEEEPEGEVTLIYHMYDNFVYMAAGSFGERTLPAKEPGDGRFHVKGRLTLVGQPEFKEIFGCLTPLLRAGGSAEKIIISPLMRYLFSPCCEAEGHLTNFGTPDYGTMMGEALSDINDWVDDLAHSKRVKNYVVICPNSCMGINEKGNVDKKLAKELARLWGRDPVHMAPAAYDLLATRLLKLAPTAIGDKCNTVPPATLTTGQ
jgi:hypothetical protein